MDRKLAQLVEKCIFGANFDGSKNSWDILHANVAPCYFSIVLLCRGNTHTGIKEAQGGSSTLKDCPWGYEKALRPTAHAPGTWPPGICGTMKTDTATLVQEEWWR